MFSVQSERALRGPDGPRAIHDLYSFFFFFFLEGALQVSPVMERVAGAHEDNMPVLEGVT